MARLRGQGVLSNAEAGRVRLVTHVDVTADDVEETLSVWKRLAGGWAASSST